MNRERIGKLLTVTGFAVLTPGRHSAFRRGKLPKRPDGGVVTQRTANPLSFSRKWPKTAKIWKSFSSLQPLFLPRHFREHGPNLLTQGVAL